MDKIFNRDPSPVPYGGYGNGDRDQRTRPARRDVGGGYRGGRRGASNDEGEREDVREGPTNVRADFALDPVRDDHDGLDYGDEVYVGEADAVPEDLEWADELRRYEDEKRHGSPYKDGQVGRPSIVTHQSRARDHGGMYNPVTQRYVDPQTEIEARRQEEVQRRKLQKNRAGHNVSHGNVIAPTPEVEYVGERVTTNHTNYSYDIVSNTPLPDDSVRISPVVRKGSRRPQDVAESGRTAKKPVETWVNQRTYNILSNESTRSGATTPRQMAGDGQVFHKAGKRKYNTSSSYNIITGKDSAGSGGYPEPRFGLSYGRR